MLTSLIALPLAFAGPPTENLDTFKGCGPTGTAKSTCGKALDKLKNRWRTPGPSKPAITLDAILATGDDTKRFSSNDGASIAGYVSSVEHGGVKESCNCARTDLQDIHIYVVRDPSDAGTPARRVVVEITPRGQHLHPEWTFDWAQKNLTHKWVRFTGWMLFDTMHSAESENTKKQPQQCGDLKVNEIWRATAWEIHPVTDLEILPKKP